MDPVSRLINRARLETAHYRNNQRIRALADQVARHAPPAGPSIHGRVPPVIFFNASTRLSGVSLNAAYSQLTAWSLRLQGVPVIHFTCNAGMHPCVLGTQRDRPTASPPCKACIAQSRALYTGEEIHWFTPKIAPSLSHDLSLLNVEGLSRFMLDGVPLGHIVLPSLRWILRRHHLKDDEATRFLLRRYILSAAGIVKDFSALVAEKQPRAVVVFNGMFYPEATAKWIADQRGIPVISHEVGLRPFSAFFTTGEATAYPLDIPADFQLSSEQDKELDAYLEQRFQGNFSMAGVRFWPEMQSLGPEFWQRADKFKQIVPVFTNVVFDTSQGHANVIFPHMFAWLDCVHDLARSNPDTFFVIRAHPDESRPGKESRETAAQWVERTGIARLPNVLFVGPDEYFSSYELIQRSKFVMIYNSTIGLEASILGTPVLSGGKARFTQIPTVFFPKSMQSFQRQAQAFLEAERVISPPEHRVNARRFLYYQIFCSSLPFNDFIEEDGIWRGYVRFKPFDWQALSPENSQSLRIISSGILKGTPFLLET